MSTAPKKFRKRDILLYGGILVAILLVVVGISWGVEHLGNKTAHKNDLENPNEQTTPAPETEEPETEPTTEAPETEPTTEATTEPTTATTPEPTTLPETTPEPETTPGPETTPEPVTTTAPTTVPETTITEPTTTESTTVSTYGAFAEVYDDGVDNTEANSGTLLIALMMLALTAVVVLAIEYYKRNR